LGKAYTYLRFMAALPTGPPPKKIEYVASDDEKALTVTFTGEDHTLGNALRHVLSKHPSTDFVGYSVPHPNEPIMNMRLQTTDQASVGVFRNGTEQLDGCCAAVLEKFNGSVVKFKASAH